MKARVFLDTDIALDLLAARHPHYDFAARLFTLADQNKLHLFVSALCFSNLHYLLTKQRGRVDSLSILRDFRVLVTVVGVDGKTINLALNSTFADFEDAIQYHAALSTGVSVLLTRNLKDYKNADIPVMTAEDYVKTLA
ncbi:MAG TPA: PIN domain-containing protein [Dinghuibacter sp.]|jgi:predicted nucleic acid-binding protein|uniref:type II toxin-antitoxin system VapC family toxin n=1 Tax=Dinghuibacter sp. TaxID=2024697 RepID=UPI002C86FA16|nr:PIN domain-containing protein [Dinghuibacter sp.]HTJ12533.1 PIN domain-containing protein [Dinghuibacter sp.]